MSRSNHNRSRGCIDLWRPGALSGCRKTADNKRLARRIQRKRDRRELNKERASCAN